MLRPVRLVEQWRRIEEGLPEGWGDARLALRVAREPGPGRASALLAPLAPGRVGEELRFAVERRGSAASPTALRRALARLDDEDVRGELALVGSTEAATAAPSARATLVDGWRAELAALPPDWSDAYVELELDSSDHLARAALLTGPANPTRHGPRPGFRYRVARRYGYGASSGMFRRCLERLDAERITGRVHVLRALSDTRPVFTQGPVWYVGGGPV